jgi:hypothetical protein
MSKTYWAGFHALESLGLRVYSHPPECTRLNLGHEGKMARNMRERITTQITDYNELQNGPKRGARERSQPRLHGHTQRVEIAKGPEKRNIAELKEHICGPPCLASCCWCPTRHAKSGAQPQTLAKLSSANCAGPMGNP